MDRARSEAKAGRVDIERDRAVSIDIRSDTEIQCVSGRVWLTQEGDPRDYCVPAGVTFCADRRGRMVLVAVEAPAALIVRTFPAGASRCVPGMLRIDAMEPLVRAAARARSDYLALAARRLLARVKRSMLGLAGQ